MAETVKVTIGGDTIALPLIMVFSQVKRTAPAVQALTSTTEWHLQVAAACAFVSALLIKERPECTVGWIEDRLRVNRANNTDERPGIVAAVSEVMLASGLITPGEVQAAAQASAAATPPTSPPS